MDDPAVVPFLASHPTTRDGRVVRDEGATYFLAGEATYTEANLQAERTDGVTNDPKRSQATLRAIKAFVADEPTIILSAYDPDGPACLATRSSFARSAR